MFLFGRRAGAQYTESEVAIVSLQSFETGPHSAAQAKPKLTAILLPPPLEGWDYRKASPYSVLFCSTGFWASVGLWCVHLGPARDEGRKLTPFLKELVVYSGRLAQDRAVMAWKKWRQRLGAKLGRRAGAPRSQM